jgi:DNA-binding response OmpR family regulator
MRILILEDEPIIAIDLEEIVSSAGCGAECTVATTVQAGVRSVEKGIDFAILDIHLGYHGKTSFPVASMLQARGIPFCFVSSSDKAMPYRYGDVPFVAKPFHPQEIAGILPRAA